MILRQIVERRPGPAPPQQPGDPADLETIVLKAMAKEPQARYATAQEMADDLKRFLADEPIRARAPTLADRAAKWARRHRPVVRAAVALVARGRGPALRRNSLGRECRQRDGATARRSDDAGTHREDLRLEAEKREEVLREQLYAADVKTAYEGWRQARLEWVDGVPARHAA